MNVERGVRLIAGVMVLLSLGLAYYFYGHVGPSPAMRADSGAITKSEPSPN